MNERIFGLIAVLFLGSVHLTEAQQPKKIARLGYLSSQVGALPTLGAFRDRLRELGWIEGNQVTFEYRYAAGNVEKLHQFATELVQSNVDIILAGPGNEAPLAAKRTTKTIPIVMVAVIDPVANGLVASLARPDGNVTGFTFEVTREQAGKNLELLREAVPKISRVTVLRTPHNTRHVEYSKEAERAAKILGLTLNFANMQEGTEKSLEEALRVLPRDRPDALLVTPHPFFVDRRQEIIEWANARRLPTIYFTSVFVVDGGLMSYGASSLDIWRRAAVYVDRILKGAKPSELPVERPTKFNLVINLKTAKQIGLTIPPTILARADRVIR